MHNPKGSKMRAKDNINFERKNRTYPIQVFRDDNGNNIKNDNNTDFSSLELVFNHKNIWGNFQNSNPFKINYELNNK